MCLLNGELGGNLWAQTDFGIEEYLDLEQNTTTYTPIPIKEILMEGIHKFAKEPYHNIVINDLDRLGLELLEYRGDEESPLYVFFPFGTLNDDEASNYTMNGSMRVEINGVGHQLNSLEEGKNFIFNKLMDLHTEIDKDPTVVVKDGIQYTIAKVEFGQTMGYRMTDLTYAGSLVGEVGEAFTSILDKIKNMLTDFEYFYDLDGRFIFQRKKVYVNMSWNNIVDTRDEEYVENAAYTSSSTYFFENSNLISAYQNTPNLTNLKNDYAIWGKRKGISGAEIPIHMRYAIDKKPNYYKSFQGITYVTDQYYGKEEGIKVDWREIIYQMALDYFQEHEKDNYTYQLKQNNIAENLYNEGQTGYEQYYADLQGFWRQLYDGKTFTEEVTKNPGALNFWFDFLDTDGVLDQFKVSAIGDRTKSVNEDTVTSIYFRETPKLIYCTREEWAEGLYRDLTGYIPVNFGAGNLESLCSISYQYKSAKDRLDELLYQNSYCIENITITSAPIYYLEPNTRIFVRDDQSKINGEYIVSRYTIPLTYNGTMSITANKAPTRLY